MWEQGTALAHFSQRGAMVRGRPLVSLGGMFSDGGDASSTTTTTAATAASAARIWPGCNASTTLPSLLPWQDTLHTQFVPQAWLNSYPLPIAKMLIDVGTIESLPGGESKYHTLHAPYTPGDWCISFSGCTAYFTQATCEALFQEGAEVARKAMGDAIARRAPPVPTLASTSPFSQ